jgi:hypothetical protein
MEYTESKYSKQHMKQDPLTSAYLRVINENASSGKVEGQSLKTDGSPFGQGSESKKNAETFYKDSGDSKVKSEVKKPTEAPAELSEDPENEPKEYKATEKLTLKDSLNPFDALFNKIISEDSFNFDSEEGVEPEQHFGGPDMIGGMEHDEEDMDEEDMGDDEEMEDEDMDEHEDLESLVSQLKDLVGKLESHLEGHIEHEEGEEGEHEFPEDSREEGEEDEDEDEEINEESVEIEEISDEKGASLTKKTGYTVKGAVPSVKGKAKVEKGKKVNGKPEDFKNEGGISSLQAKSSFDAKGVKPGKFLFDDQSGE